MSKVYLNGEYLPADEAKISVLDRGFIFGDGVYEVIPVYGARLFRAAHHLQRLSRGLQEIQIENPLSEERWIEILEELIQQNGGGDQSLYLQVTRGIAPRDHRFPDAINPTIFAMSNPLAEVDLSTQQGISAVLLEDNRWLRCNIKSISLLPNILLKQQAYDADGGEALLMRNGFVTEGAASNIIIVKGDSLITPPQSNHLLPGITRDLVIELCRTHNIPHELRPITREELFAADEVWVTSSTKEIVPIITIDDRPVGDGRIGDVWRKMTRIYREYKQAFREGKVE
ncbi:MAG: D-amino acid aminotransferase [Gammaproteobacteria bacterium]|nr:D-amino acid aminotransferase [Gammaproteobacteria bacterium]